MGLRLILSGWHLPADTDDSVRAQEAISGNVIRTKQKTTWTQKLTAVSGTGTDWNKIQTRRNSPFCLHYGFNCNPAKFMW